MIGLGFFQLQYNYLIDNKMMLSLIHKHMEIKKMIWILWLQLIHLFLEYQDCNYFHQIEMLIMKKLCHNFQKKQLLKMHKYNQEPQMIRLMPN